MGQRGGGGHPQNALKTSNEQSRFNTYFAIGESATHQISHTKGFVADGKAGGEGSTNWSASGEGIFVVKGKAGGPGYKAQNNTQSIFTDPDTVTRFQTELIAEHMSAKSQQSAGKDAPPQSSKPVISPMNVRASAKSKGAKT